MYYSLHVCPQIIFEWASLVDNVPMLYYLYPTYIFLFHEHVETVQFYWKIGHKTENDEDVWNSKVPITCSNLL